MTFEQKVEKLRGIVDKKIAIWCRNKVDAEELYPLLNEVTNENFIGSMWYIDEIKSVYDIITGEWDCCSLDYYEKEGYQIIPYSEFFADKVEDEPLGEWTLKEVKEYCKYGEMSKDNPDYCNECKCNKICGMCADEWDLSDKQILTQSEIDILKAIKVLFPRCTNVYVTDDDAEYIYKSNGSQIISVEITKFPSLTPYKEYPINELLNEVE